MTGRRLLASLALGAAVLGAVVLVSCGRTRTATESDCAALLDRLVELELVERGFHDPALVARWRTGAQAKFAPELAACRGRRLPSSALACAARATTAEEVAHRCLR
jgi:hypothetical protein